MKKLYLSLIALIFYGSLIAQSAFNGANHPKHKAFISPNSKKNSHHNGSSRSAGPFRLWTEPVGDIMKNKGLDLQSSTANQNIFLDIIYEDSTVRVAWGPNTDDFVNDIFLGSVLDPKSNLLQSSNDPIVSNNDAYSIDSLAILGSYVKKTANIDTLYTWLVWGDPTNTNVFSKRATGSVWGAPMSNWRTSVIGAAVSGATGAPGNKISPTAPSSNKMLIKYVLTNSDSVGSSDGLLKPIFIALPTPINVPAGNILSCFYTFVPGGTHVNGDCCYSFTGSLLIQNINGFAGAVWGQETPTVTVISDYVDQQVDSTSWCMGATYSKNQRHAVYNTALCNSLFGNLITAPIICYSIYGTSTVGNSPPLGVWPGDADSNAIVDNNDLLTVGLYYGQTGSPRASTSNVWQADTAASWGIAENNGVDLKNADCNGDGIIDGNDTLAINLNFNLTHAISIDNNHNNNQRTASDLYFVTTGSSFNAGDWVDAQLWLGTSTNPVNNLYGIAFNIHYDASLVQPGTELITYSTSWLGTPGINAIKITKTDANANTAYGAVTRTDHTDISGYGKIADFKFQVKTSIASTSEFHFSISNYKANNATGVSQEFNTIKDSVIVNAGTVGITEINTFIGITISPNPFTSQTLITFNEEQKTSTIKIIDVLGKEVKRIDFKGKQLTIEKGEMKEGIYFLQIIDENKNVVNKKIVVQ